MNQSVPASSLEPPLRGESFSSEHLWAHAAQMAAVHGLSPRGFDDRPVIDAFERNARFIAVTYRTMTTAVREGEPIPPAAEWVLDNYHIVEEQLRQIREDLPRGFYYELPKLGEGPCAGFPRVYHLAHELVLHTDSNLDLELICGFIDAYQRTTPLTSGELWAVPIMLRLVLIENLRRLCAHILEAQAHQRHAERLIQDWRADTSQAGKSSGARPRRGQSETLPAPADHPLLIMHLMDCLRESNLEQRGISLGEVAQRLGQPHDTIDDLVRKEQQRLAADQVSIGNLITTVQLLGGLDWKAFFERVSLVEQALREDPMHVYPFLDFATRDMYRHEIEYMSRHCLYDEIQIASHAIGLAVESERRELTDGRRRHVGYFLIDEGRVELERLIGCHPGASEMARRYVRRNAAVFYLGGVCALTAAGATAVGAIALASGAHTTMGWLLALLAVVPVSELVVGLMNLLVTNLFRPRVIPKIEFTDRIPAHCQGLIVIPGMLTSGAGIRALLERLEIHYLSNPEPGLQFALLTDFADAPHEKMPGDDALLLQAQAGIGALNSRYCSRADKCAADRFHLLHRTRRWNSVENRWMGWERKRGKLEELNELLRGGTRTSYLGGESLARRLAGIKYVITLDADTRLPYGAAKRLIGTIAHPLNRAHVDTVLGRVTRGYGILQPRVTVSLASATRSLFARLFANSPGLDPYCLAVSDVYQDLFAEGSYTGKGIYDVDAFRAVAGQTFPENHILSHDLIEGCYASGNAQVGGTAETLETAQARHLADRNRRDPDRRCPRSNAALRFRRGEAAGTER
jgi:cyclic beta-1,2-glucan synthetase